MRALLVGVLLLGACHRHAAEDARATLIDRNWLDVWPTSERERLHVYRFTPKMGGGVFQDRTLFKGEFELFQFDTSGDELTFRLPQTHDTVRTRYRIEHVDGPAPFDLKLTIEPDPRGPGVYYGISSETGAAALDARLAGLPR